MSKKYEDYDYDDNDETSSNSTLAKKVLIILLIVIAIFIIIYLLKGCERRGNNPDTPTPTPITFNYEDALIESAKKYFNINDDMLPSNAGECTQVTLGTLNTERLIDITGFSSCDTNNTYVRTCMLTNGSIQYTPWLTCGDKNSENDYYPLQEGTINDVIANKTYVDFKFLPQYLTSKGTKLGKEEEMWKSDITYSSYKTLKTTKYYRYRDKLFTWKVGVKSYYKDATAKSTVAQYFTTEPNKSYAMYDNKTSNAYKWYLKVYYVDPKNNAKAFSLTAPDNVYTEKGEAIPYTKYKTAKKYTTFSPYLYHVCVEGSDPKGPIVYSQIECKDRPGDTYKTERGTVYACKSYGSNATVYDKIVDGANSPCYNVTEWTDWTETKCDTTSKLCTSATVNLYTWYKRSYYPSGSMTANKEKVYYVDAPVEGAIKDSSTNANAAYRWYKLTETTTTNYTATAPSGYDTATKTTDYKWSDWSDWSTKNPKVSDGRSRSIETKSKIKLQQILGTTDSSWNNLTADYVSKDEMINAFKNKKYNVNTLDDINNNGEIRYQIKMYVRNKKEAN